jgi:hypothetical protein
MAAFLPSSGLIVMMRSSRAIAIVLKHQLSQHLDNLFILAQPDIYFADRFYYCLHIELLMRELEALCGEASVSHDNSTYYFVEARKGYVWPSRKIEVTPHPSGFAYRCYMVSGSAYYSHDVSRFRTWLQRRLEQLRIVETQVATIVTAAP